MNMVQLAISTTQTIDLINIGVIASVATSLLFIIGYSVRAKWWRYRVGRAVVSLDAAVTVTLLPSALHLIFNFHTTGTFYNWYHVVSLFLVALTPLWRLYTINYVQAHRDPPDDDQPEKEEVE
jgi:hypothetical protein